MMLMTFTPRQNPGASIYIKG